MDSNTIDTKIPLSFELYDFFNENDRNLLYIDDDPKEIKLNLEIVNNLDKAIQLNPYIGNSEPSPNNFHLELQFRPGELSDLSLKQIDLDENSKQNWSVCRPVEERNGCVSIYILRKNQACIIQPQDGEGRKGKQTITFKGIAASASNGVRGSALNIHYKDFYFLIDDKETKIENNFALILTILAHRSRINAPLSMCFNRQNDMLIHGKEEGFIIQISNIGKENITLNKESKFIITIRAEGEKKDPLALIKKDDAQSIDIHVFVSSRQLEYRKIKDNDIMWVVSFNNQAQDPEWTLTPNLDYNQNIAVDQNIEIYIENIKTELQPGIGNIYVRHEGLPGYSPDTKVLDVRRTYLVESTTGGIGIGTRPYSNEFIGNQLIVNGKITSDSLLVEKNIKGGSISAISFSGEGAAVTGMVTMWYGDEEEIPRGWALCDGKNGTPDLRDRFIMGASKETSRKCGEPDKHNHNVEIPNRENLYTESVGNHSHKLPNWFVEEKANKKIMLPLGTNERDNFFWAIDAGGPVETIKSSGEAGYHNHKFTINTFNTDLSSSENRPRWCALYFIIKVTTINIPSEGSIRFSRGTTQWRTASGFSLSFDLDGNFVLYNPKKQPLWSSGTTGTKAGTLILNPNGYFALKDETPGKNELIWTNQPKKTESNESETQFEPNSYLILHENGNIGCYSNDRRGLFYLKLNHE